MATSMKIIGMNVSGQQLRVSTLITLTGNYTTGGDTLDFTSLLGQGYLSKVFVASNPPTQGDVSFSNAAGVGWIGSVIPGTTLKNNLLKIIVSSTGAEVAAGAYAAGLLADNNINAEFIFDLLQ